MTYDSSLQSNGCASKKTVSTEKMLDCEASPDVKQEEELPVTTSNAATTAAATKLALPPYTHRRSQSYNIEFQYNKNTLGLQVNFHSGAHSGHRHAKKSHANSQSREALPSKQRSVAAVAAPTAERESMSELEEPPFVQAFLTYFCYTVLRWFGNLRELLRSAGIERRKGAKDNNSDVSNLTTAWVIKSFGFVLGILTNFGLFFW